MSSSNLLQGAGGFISLSDAKIMTARYRAEREQILALGYKNQNILLNSETFDRVYFDAVLGQPNCAGLRVYFAMDEELKVKVIVVGVDADDKDILPSSANGLANGQGDGDDTGIIEFGRPCPEQCPQDPPL